MNTAVRQVSRAIAALAAAASLPALSAEPEASTIERRQFFIAGVSVGNSEPQIIRAFGKPNSVRRYFSELGQAPATVMKFPLASAKFLSGKADEIASESPRHRLPSGIGVGQSRARFLAEYGSSESWIQDALQVDRYNLRGSDCYLSFYSKEERVVRIVLWCDNA